MIDTSNFKEVLLRLGFSQEGEFFYRTYEETDAYLKVDFNKERLIYPTDKELLINGDFTTSFNQKENFVVFECVHRLFEKGYKPEHIELEPKWTVGHGASGGRADIMVKDNSGKSLFIVECKTPGREFEEEWNKTLLHGGQLISYGKQAGSTQYVCLYASDYVNNRVQYYNYIISLMDNDKLLEELADKEPLSFKDAKLLDKEDIYRAWKETYALDYSTKGIFEEDIPPYEIGKVKYTLKDLSTISHKDIQGKYHEFASILRQHNVSGRENAFDKLVNLFLSKIVDETNNPNELKFYWKGIAYDNFFDLQDRLQKLYQEGMKRFLGEDVTYIDNDSIDDAFRFFKNDPDATKETIKKYFRNLKFFTNNDFAFIDVHNEKLFYQNSEVLLKVVHMLQDIQLKTEEQNQFLGDMFEGFLDQGVKQSEGQYFTPMPIVKFILKSLPIEKVVLEEEQIPKVIDYACGAGHFLNEYAQQIKPIVEENKDVGIEKYFQEISGIEKEYRLSKVAKVSSFMYGQDDINIIYADALADNPRISEGEYSILVANPPYSVKGFLETLSEKERKEYELINYVGDKSYANNNSIETFFIERAKQLLKPGGVAGIIVPTSILTNGKAKSTSKSKNLYVATRELLLKYFDIVAITEFGSGTFGKTGTNTVTLFIRRKEKDPDPATHFWNRVNDWFRNDSSKERIFSDEYLIKRYCDFNEIQLEDYKSLLRGAPSECLKEYEFYKAYLNEFNNWAEIKNLKKRQGFKKLSGEEQDELLNRKFIEYMQNAEKDKLYFFILAYNNPNKVIVVKSPSKIGELKKFLGYEWSSAKGNEGIHYLGDVKIDEVQKSADEEQEVILEDEDKRVLSNIFNLDNINTPLYDPTDVYNTKKINNVILNNFNQKDIQIPEELEPYVSTYNLYELMDFSNPDFNKSIGTSPKKKIMVNSRWDSKKIGDIESIEVKKGTSITSRELIEGNVPVVAGGISSTSYHNEANREKNVITVSASGASAGFVNYWDVPIFASDCTTIYSEDENFTFYVYNILRSIQDEIFSFARGAAQPHVYADDLKGIRIPVPPKEVQQEMVKKLKEIDDEERHAYEKIQSFREKIRSVQEGIYNSNHSMRKIRDIIIGEPQYGINEQMNTYSKGFKIFRMNEIIQGYMHDNGSMKYVDMDKDEFKKYKLEKGDILFNRTNSIEHVGKTGLFNLEGDYCFASYLIRIKVDPEEVVPEYVNLVMNSKMFQDEAKGQATRSINQANINAVKLINFYIPIPQNKEVQERLVYEVQQYEEQIKESQIFLSEVASMKKEILKKYL